MDIAELIRTGTLSLWLLLPMAVALGALHGLEPGHSKTMMAAFIVAIKGTVAQAVLLALSATISHTAIVWLIALGGLYLGQSFAVESVEPWLHLIASLIMLGLGVWMVWQVWRTNRARHHHATHDHTHSHDDDDEDAHARHHAQQIRTQFASGKATTTQIILFGLTGGLLPCPAAITVLLLCLQLKEIALGVWLVLGFSIGLALTFLVVGAGAALAVSQISGRFAFMDKVIARAPYVSAGIILLLGIAFFINAVLHFHI